MAILKPTSKYIAIIGPRVPYDKRITNVTLKRPACSFFHLKAHNDKDARMSFKKQFGTIAATLYKKLA